MNTLLSHSSCSLKSFLNGPWQLTRKLLPGIFILIGLWQMGQGLWIQSKAVLAQHLISSAWEKNLETSQVVKPWSWADTWPVAKLSDTRSQTTMYVLDGAQGNSLAFGPGYLHGSAKPGFPGTSVVGGHRDTHFTFLQQTEKDDIFQIENTNGEIKYYRVNSMRVVDSRHEPLMAYSEKDQLLLVTCYPFNAVRANGSLRYVVTAELVES